MNKLLPRGLRNNNPLNIVWNKNNQWVGQSDARTDKVFCEFKEIRHGWRAAFLLLRRYYLRWDIETVRDVIFRWAPTSENNSQAYYERVVELMKINGPVFNQSEDKWNELLTGKLPPWRSHPHFYMALAYSMALIENGVSHISPLPLFEGYSMAAMSLDKGSGSGETEIIELDPIKS